MSHVAYLAGQYLPHRSACSDIEEHGYQFADGVYEVLAVVNGPLADRDPRRARVMRWLPELRIAAPVSEAASRNVIHAVILPNWVRDRIAYLQVRCDVAVRINGSSIPYGVPGPLTRRVRGLQLAAAGVA
jgi:D-alanine transaminase